MKLYRLPVFLLLSAILLCVQFGALLHGVQHPFHEHTSSCEAFVAAEHQGLGLLLSIAFSLPPAFPIWLSSFSNYRIFPLFQRLFSARAPPVAFS